MVMSLPSEKVVKAVPVHVAGQWSPRAGAGSLDFDASGNASASEGGSGFVGGAGSKAVPLKASFSGSSPRAQGAGARTTRSSVVHHPSTSQPRSSCTSASQPAYSRAAPMPRPPHHIRSMSAPGQHAFVAHRLVPLSSLSLEQQQHIRQQRILQQQQQQQQHRHPSHYQNRQQHFQPYQHRQPQHHHQQSHYWDGRRRATIPATSGGHSQRAPPRGVMVRVPTLRAIRSAPSMMGRQHAVEPWARGRVAGPAHPGASLVGKARRRSTLVHPLDSMGYRQRLVRRPRGLGVAAGPRPGQPGRPRQLVRRQSMAMFGESAHRRRWERRLLLLPALSSSLNSLFRHSRTHDGSRQADAAH